MKTKVYKLKENIARYMYEYIERDDVSIYLDREVCASDRWEVHSPEELPYNKIEKIRDIDHSLGIRIAVMYGRYDYPHDNILLWNKEKEDKYLKIRKEQELRNKEFQQKLHSLYVGLDYFSFPLCLFDKVIKTSLSKRKK